MPIVGTIWPVFEPGLMGRWDVVVGTLYATFSPKD